MLLSSGMSWTPVLAADLDASLYSCRAQHTARVRVRRHERHHAAPASGRCTSDAKILISTVTRNSLVRALMDVRQRLWHHAGWTDGLVLCHTALRHPETALCGCTATYSNDDAQAVCYDEADDAGDHVQITFWREHGTDIISFTSF